MRIFPTVREALLEIRRDVYKSPEVPSSRVQSVVTEHGRTHEAVYYSYGVKAAGIPYTPAELVEVVAPILPFWEQNRQAMINWLGRELDVRIGGFLGMDGLMGISTEQSAESYHPELAKYFEGNEASYYYMDRLYGGAPAMIKALSQEGSRRAYWPIFREEDAIRAHRLTRIPCTLGYNWLIRPSTFLGSGWIMDAGIQQRSCDFDKFMISDLWFTYRLTTALAENFPVDHSFYDADVELDMVYHHAISLHAFIDSEIF